MARLYLLDTNTLSHLIRQPQGPVADRIADVGEANVLTGVIVACELRYLGEEARDLAVLGKVDGQAPRDQRGLGIVLLAHVPVPQRELGLDVL